jgi:hypothetical protein
MVFEKSHELLKGVHINVMISTLPVQIHGFHATTSVGLARDQGLQPGKLVVTVHSHRTLVLEQGHSKLV